MNARLKPVSSETISSSIARPGAKRDALLATLAGLLRQSFALRYEGGSHAKMAQCQGYADGFMRALLDGGVVSEREMLEFVQDVRRGVDGPATRHLESDESIFAA